jgi:hypothetical protein
MAAIKCWLGALLLAWVVQIFGTSALVAIFLHSEATVPAIWAVADDVAPFAKISFILFLALLVTPLRHHDLAAWPSQLAWWTMASVTALLLVLALLPAYLSRGFGIGLTGARFDPAVLPVYLSGAILGGIAGGLLHRRCRLRSRP